MPSHIVGFLDLDENKLHKDLETIKNFPRISEEYDEFSTGLWMNCSLWNSSGDKLDTTYRDFEHPALQTEYACQLPYLDHFIRKNFTLKYLKMVRTRNLIDAMVIPHKDFIELNKPQNQYLRLFIPLEDNEMAFHSDEQTVFRMRKGEVWFLDAAIVHAAANFSNQSRMMLCLDYAFPENFDFTDIFVDNKNYNPKIQPFVVPRETLEPGFEEELISSFSKIITMYNFKNVVFLLSKIHFYKQVRIEACFDWLIEIGKKCQYPAILKKAQAMRTYLIIHRDFKERFSFDEQSNLVITAK